ncbi:MAG: hypothetical protein P8Y24_13770 [Gammaproteobacteria bacterium]
MIDIDRFDISKSLVCAVLDNVSKKLSHDLGLHVAIILQDSVDDEILERMEQLEQEIFSIEDNVYSRNDILECLAEEDSLLLLLKINNNIEGYAFGYNEDEDDPTVRGTDYFIDSALVSLQYEHKGIGEIISGVMFMMLYLLGYRSIGILTEEKDKTGRELVKFYQRLGFELVDNTEEYGCAMRKQLNKEFYRQVCSRLGVAD